MGEEPDRSAFRKLVSVPGLAAVAILGAAVAVAARLLGPGNVLREIVTELVASFGSTILVLAVFGLLFRTGLERLLRGAPGGETFARSAERLEVLLRGVEAQNADTQETGLGSRLDRIEGDVRPLVGEVSALRREISDLRELLADLRDDRPN